MSQRNAGTDARLHDRLHDRLRARGRGLVGQVREAVTERDVVPGLRRLVRDLVRVEVIDRSMVIAAQALLALVPLLIVLGAFLPHDVGQLLVGRFESATGLDRGGTATTTTALTPDQVRTETGVAGLVLVIVSATSFARAVQRLFERVWEQPHVGGVAGARRCFVWLTGWLVLLPLVGLSSTLVGGWVPWGVGVRVVQVVLGTLVWWWSARVLLLGRVSWRRLAPGALLTGMSIVVYSTASGVVMPAYARSSAEQLGTLGLVLAATTWLIGFGFLLVVASVVGRVLAVDEDVHRGLASLRLLQHRRSGHHLHEQQRDARDDQ